MVKRLKNFIILAPVLLWITMATGCRPRDYCNLPAFSKRNYLQAVVEIPAGTNQEIYYCPGTRRFRLKRINGTDQKVSFLPYPANYGFIPSTNIYTGDKDKGRMLPVMIIAESQHVGKIMEIIPVCMLILQDDLSMDYKIIAVPVDKRQRIVQANSFEKLKKKYPELTGIIEKWFLNCGLYKNPKILGWEDEHYTQQFIDKWLVKKGRNGTRGG